MKLGLSLFLHKLIWSWKEDSTVHSELVWKLLLIEEAPEKETQAPRAGCLLVFSVLRLGQRCIGIVLSRLPSFASLHGMWHCRDLLAAEVRPCVVADMETDPTFPERLWLAHSHLLRNHYEDLGPERPVCIFLPTFVHACIKHLWGTFCVPSTVYCARDAERDQK